MTWNAQLRDDRARRAVHPHQPEDIQWTVGVAVPLGHGAVDRRHPRRLAADDGRQLAALRGPCPQAGSEITVKNLDNGD